MEFMIRRLRELRGKKQMTLKKKPSALIRLAIKT